MKENIIPCISTIVFLSLYIAGCGGERTSLPETCNGSPEYCARRYNELAYPTAHNAMSCADAGWAMPNHYHCIEQQLHDGIRAFMLDLHYFGGEVCLCHGVCMLGYRRLEEALRVFKSFLETNPGEVLTFIFESYVEPEDVKNIFKSTGLLKYVHSQNPDEEWPTLEEMVTSGMRLVVFTDYGGGRYSWYLDIWKFAWETPYSVKHGEEFPCTVNRGEPTNSLFILNHFVTDPLAFPDYAKEVNSYSSLIEHIHRCALLYNRLPNFVAVDFYSVGDLMKVVKEVNSSLKPAP